MNLFSIEDLSKELGVTYATVKQHIAKGAFKPQKFGRRYLFSDEEFNRCIKIYKKKKIKSPKAPTQARTSLEVLAYLQKMDQQHREMLLRIKELSEAILVLARDSQDRPPAPPKLSSVVLKK